MGWTCVYLSQQLSFAPYLVDVGGVDGCDVWEWVGLGGRWIGVIAP